MSLRATCFFFAFTLDLSVLAVVAAALLVPLLALRLVVPPVLAEVLPLNESEPLREEVSLSLTGLGLSVAVPLPLDGIPLELIGVEGADAVLDGAAVVDPFSAVLPRVLDETLGAAPGWPSFEPVPPFAVVDADGSADGAVVVGAVVDGALYVELLVCDAESAVAAFLFLFMSPMASAEALPSTRIEEKNTGASLRIESS
jgi:hypothetical protein